MRIAKLPDLRVEKACVGVGVPVHPPRLARTTRSGVQSHCGYRVPGGILRREDARLVAAHRFFKDVPTARTTRCAPWQNTQFGQKIIL